ncbi:GntR family transcriptional regulator [Puniceibacterium sp. IMCC21224]|uniref:GntR family transcriptional regulator n=1 Tax=Puniceibacterium sp. IMCC21224 TaxID=1618204 RepID=UPI00064D7D81|nr:GntR family transcriptional regulator [Puniceibacterium sp. IMCC21224]KMK66419.1 transcriptional regulator, GntR family [Puniceibacterium sp. IMCC21224]
MTESAILGPLEPVARASVTDQVFEALHAQVLSLALPPGTKLSESDVAKQLGVSRQPVRDAFYRLSKLGFLLIQPQKATLVSKIHTQDVRRARFIRTAIEVDVMRLAADRFGPEDFERLEPNLAAQADAVENGDRTEFHRLDDLFHQMLCESAGVGYVWDVIRENKAHTDRVRYLSLAGGGGSQLAYNDHCAVIHALKQGDAGGAVMAMRKHLGTIEGIIQQLREDNHSWFSEEELGA